MGHFRKSPIAGYGERRMRMKIKIGLVLLLIISSSNSGAVTTRVWRQTSREEFDAGKLECVSTTSRGDILLAPLVEEFDDTGELYIWALAADAKGNIFAGTGNGGKIFRLSGKGKVSGKRKISLLYDSPELEVQSLAVDKSGNVYAGTSPGAVIYRITPAGKASTFCDLEDCHVWCLTFDSRGNLYAGTGDKGKIYRITPGGKAACLYDSNQTHILCLMRDEEDNFYAGSEPDGIVYKISSDGDVSVLYDAVEGEIHALALDMSGNLYAGTASGRTAAVQSQKANTQTPGKVTEKRTSPAATPNSVYRISPSGRVSRIFRTAKELIFSIVPDDDGNIYIGTGNEGMIYKVSPDDKEFAALYKSQNLQVLSMFWQDGRLYFGTGNVGRIYNLADSYSEEGTFTSFVPGALPSISRWGNISWRQTLPRGTEILLSTRSGNTEKPDDTWSEWSESFSNSSGERIKSPPRRFIQYRAHLKSSVSSATPILHEVTVYGLADNQPPEIQSVKVESYKRRKQAQKAGGKKKSGGEEIRKGEKMAVWIAHDPDGDTLLYDIYYRGEAEKNWKKLKDDIKKTSHRWDTITFPDGYYLLKVVARDTSDNPPDKEESAEKVTDPFLVDNTPPRVEKLTHLIPLTPPLIKGVGRIKEKDSNLKSPTKYAIKGIARDETSEIAKIEYSLDAEDWIDIFSEDDILDSKEEPFKFTISSLSSGEHTVVVKLTDSQGNVGTGKVVFKTE